MESLESSETSAYNITLTAGDLTKRKQTTKLILISEIWGSHGSEYQYYVILGYEVIALIHTDVLEEAATCFFGFELRSLFPDKGNSYPYFDQPRGLVVKVSDY